MIRGHPLWFPTRGDRPWFEFRDLIGQFHIGSLT